MQGIEDSLLVHGHQLHLTNIRLHNLTLSDLTSSNTILKQLLEETGNVESLTRKVSTTVEGVKTTTL